MNIKWDEKYKIDDGNPINTLPQCDITYLGILIHEYFEKFTHLLGMDNDLAIIRASPEKGVKLLQLWSSKCGPQATIRVLKMTFYKHGYFLNKLDELTWGLDNLSITWTHDGRTSSKIMSKVPRKVPLMEGLKRFFENIFPHRVTIFEVNGCRRLDEYTCGDFVGTELKVLIKAFQEPEDITSMPGYFNVTREEASNMLMNEDTGTYLIRHCMTESDKPKHAISTIFNGQILHFLIYASVESSTNTPEYFLFNDGHRTYNVNDLISCYSKNNLCTNLDCVPRFKLKTPLEVDQKTCE